MFASWMCIEICIAGFASSPLNRWYLIPFPLNVLKLIVFCNRICLNIISISPFEFMLLVVSFFFFENALPCQVDCQQLAGDTCDVTGLAEFMVEVGCGWGWRGALDAWRLPRKQRLGRWFLGKGWGNKSWGFLILLRWYDSLNCMEILRFPETGGYSNHHIEYIPSTKQGFIRGSISWGGFIQTYLLGI